MYPNYYLMKKDSLKYAGEYEVKEIMIPNIEEFVKLFDFENKIVIISNIEQFIDWRGKNDNKYYNTISWYV